MVVEIRDKEYETLFGTFWRDILHIFLGLDLNHELFEKGISVK